MPLKVTLMRKLKYHQLIDNEVDDKIINLLKIFIRKKNVKKTQNIFAKIFVCRTFAYRLRDKKTPSVKTRGL